MKCDYCGVMSASPCQTPAEAKRSCDVDTLGDTDVEEVGTGVEPVARKGGRRYVPSLAQLVDALTITQMKEIFIKEAASEYADEIADIMHDIDLVLRQATQSFDAKALHAVVMIALTNRVIWENEAAIRQGVEGGESVEKRLRFTHSINGVRNTAKNKLTARMGGRLDYKIDCLAADLVADFGNWNIFEGK